MLACESTMLRPASRCAWRGAVDLYGRTERIGIRDRAAEDPRREGTARTGVDRFILAALEAKQLALNPEADRATLVRRVSFDLTGLPPTIAEIEQFLADKSPDAYEQMVEPLLSLGPCHYGERWGKFWLEAAGYADSNGYFNADSDRPLAWKYRDYVIESINADKPYDKFVREQLAGDQLAGYAAWQRASRRRWSKALYRDALPPQRPTILAKATATRTRCAPTASPCSKATCRTS